MLSNERKKIAGSEFQKNLTGRANARTFVIGGCSHEKCQYRLDLDTVVTKTDFRVHKKRPKGEVVRTLNGNDKRPKTNPRIWRRTMKNQAGGGGVLDNYHLHSDNGGHVPKRFGLDSNTKARMRSTEYYNLRKRVLRLRNSPLEPARSLVFTDRGDSIQSW